MDFSQNVKMQNLIQIKSHKPKSQPFALGCHDDGYKHDVLHDAQWVRPKRLPVLDSPALLLANINFASEPAPVVETLRELPEPNSSA